MRRYIRALAVGSMAVGLLSGVTPLLGVAVGAAATTQTTSTRYVRNVCGALNTWTDKTTDDISGPLKALEANKRSPKGTRQAIANVYASQMKATDTLIATTKAIGVPRLPNGQQLATDYLQTLGDARAAYSTAQLAALHATIANKTVLATAVDAVDGKLVTALISIGNPLSALNADPTLTAAIQGDAGCATVMDFYRPATTSGLSVGDCTNDTEQPISCSQPHWGEVTLVTSYPADSTAPWPGNDVMSAFTNQTCDVAFGTYVGVPLEQSEYNAGWFSPNPGTDWSGGDREVVCTVISGDTNGSITGSLKGSTT